MLYLHKSVIYSWRASMKSFSLPNMHFESLSSWKKSGKCLCNCDSGISSSADGLVLQEERSYWEKQHARGLSAAPSLSNCSWIVEQHSVAHPPAPASCLIGIGWSGVTREKSLVRRLSYPELRLYLTYLEISLTCETLSAFLLIRITEYCWP